MFKLVKTNTPVLKLDGNTGVMARRDAAAAARAAEAAALATGASADAASAAGVSASAAVLAERSAAVLADRAANPIRTLMTLSERERNKISILGINQEELHEIAIAITTNKGIQEEEDKFTIINSQLTTLFISLSKMSGRDIIKLYTEIEEEHKDDTIEFTIVRSPCSGRLIAHVSTLIHKGNNLLLGENIMLYQSTGESRQTGLNNYWMPYSGENIEHVAKLEDKYVSALESYKTNNVFKYQIPILSNIIRNIISYNHYMRFISKAYLIASFLLKEKSIKYITKIEVPINDEDIEHNKYIDKYIREYTPYEYKSARSYLHNKCSNPSGSMNNEPSPDFIPITAYIIDKMMEYPPANYGANAMPASAAASAMPAAAGASAAASAANNKYLKYKNKYISLKNIRNL
jgi:hypothetical protein